MLHFRPRAALAFVSLIVAAGSALAQGAPMQLTPPPGGAARPAPPATSPAQPATPGTPGQQKPSVERINAYLNSIVGLTANFSQTGADGRRADGTLHILRPGRMRFEYQPPSPLEVVSDGRSVAVRDRKLKTQDIYHVNQTPLKFLTQARIDVGRDARVVSLNQQGNEAVLVLEDKQTFGGTSRIRLVFANSEPMVLKQWTVTDPNGYDTRVALSNLDTSKRPPAGIFHIQDVNLDRN